MSRKDRRTADWDDGRTVADMGDISPQPVLFPKQRRKSLEASGSPDHSEPPPTPYTRQERRWVALGALKAALLIALVFVAGLGLLIALLLRLWT